MRTSWFHLHTVQKLEKITYIGRKLLPQKSGEWLPLWEEDRMQLGASVLQAIFDNDASDQDYLLYSYSLNCADVLYSLF